MDYKRFKMLKKLIIAGIILCSAITSAAAFTLPKLKIIYARPAAARIHGPVSGLPVLTVNFVNKPLWSVLQDVSSKTGYMFTSRRVNLGKKITIKGKYNLAELLSKLFAKDTVKIIPAEKKVYIEG